MLIVIKQVQIKKLFQKTKTNNLNKHSPFHLFWVPRDSPFYSTKHAIFYK